MLDPLSTVVGRMDNLQEMIVNLFTGERLPQRGLDSTLYKAYLEDGVVSILAGTMPCGMAPGDIEEFPFPIDPLKSWVLAAVHLGHQPGLQPHTAWWWGNPRGWLVHGKGLCRRKQSGVQQIHIKMLHALRRRHGDVSPVHLGI